MSSLRSRITLVALAALLGAAACGDSGVAPAVSSGGAGGGVAGSVAAAGMVGAAGSVGASTMGGGGASGQAAAGAASGGSASGGAAGAAGSVAQAGGGAGGASAAGTGGGGAGGSGGGSSSGIASELDKFRLECPCVDANHFGADKQDNCDNAPTVDRQTYQKKLGGDPGTVYDVKLHVRGNTEPNTYVNGKLEQQRFYIGGETSTAGYTSYMLTVGDPQQVYFFNYNPTTGHIHFLIDYEVVIPMRGGTTVTFEVNGGKSKPDGHGVSNREALVVPGVPPAPDPFNGQLVQFDVVSVQPHAP